MRFIQLSVGKKFSLPRENNEYIYTKINDNKHNNASGDDGIHSFHGCTQVKEIN